ncbi:MAG TPA: glycosyltransferase [Solirubrobacteraceae bacterium]|nr:glycosyltransferase [Solirubrobacteraceae bacterium]
MAEHLGAPLTATTIGMSLGPTSGMRDHARLLSEALPAEGIESSLLWLERAAGSLPGARAEVRRWAQTLGGELERRRPSAIVLHYASFAYAYRGLPVLLGPTLAAARRADAPVIAVLHELAYPWRRAGARGAVWAATHRLALIPLMRACAAAVLTTEQRRQWLASRRWLPARRLEVAPVFSNLPPPSGQVNVQEGLIGLFGYAYEGAAVAVVLDAVRELRDRGTDASLQLLGAPGPGSPTASLWEAEAERRGIGRALSFTGRQPAQEISDALARCAVLLCAASPGPTSRKGSLAGSLASGRPVVALDGPLTWTELVERDAARVVAANPAALAGELGRLLADDAERDGLGVRGRDFYDRRMAVTRTAELVASLIRELA